MMKDQVASGSLLTPARGGMAALLALIGALALGLWRPALAWPDWAMLEATLISVAALILIPATRASRSPLPILAVLFIAPWLGVWALAHNGAPVPALAAEPTLTACFAAVAFGAALVAGALRRGWIAVPAALLTLLLALHGLFAIYQVLGPAGLPMTYATQAAALEATPYDDPGMKQAILHTLREGRASGTIGAANIFATMMLVGALLGIGGAADRWSRGDRRWAVIFALCSAVAAVALLLTQSRGGLLGFLAGVGLLGALPLLARLNPRLRIRLALVGIVAVIVAAAAFLIAVVLIDARESRWLGVGGLQVRLAYWRSAAAMLQEDGGFGWFAGNGAGSFEAWYPGYRLPGADETRYAHSWIFELLTATGLPGLLLFTGGLAALFAKAVGRLMTELAAHRRGSFWGLALLAALTGMLVHGLFDYTLSHREGLLLFALLAGLVAGQSRIRLPGLPAALAIAALALGLLLLGQRSHSRNEILLEQAQAMMAMGEPPDEIAPLIEELQKSAPRDFRFWEAGGHLAAMRGDRDGYLGGLKQAATWNIFSARLRELLAEEHARRGEWPEALRLQGVAVSLHPLDLHHQLTLASMLNRSGDREGGIAVYTAALTLKAFRPADQERREAVAAELSVDSATGAPLDQ